MLQQLRIGPMWLLDVNLPNGLLGLLHEYGIQAETTAYRGWRDLGNGKLAEAAFGAGFRALLTRDRLFGESAGRALERFPELAVVVVRLPQAREAAYLAEFRRRWAEQALCPRPGHVIEWPVALVY
ncbi:hypothetical protein WDW37_06810 [Bdellovibrionota bacterium FG-1]